jgi:hypothetical protein
VDTIRMMRCVKHVACPVAKRNAKEILVVKQEGTDGGDITTYLK